MGNSLLRMVSVIFFAVPLAKNLQPTTAITAAAVMKAASVAMPSGRNSEPVTAAAIPRKISAPPTSCCAVRGLILQVLAFQYLK